ncbi:MAG: ribonuclease HII [Christensenellales bacterium]|jgi:ribonuclease HII
MKYIYDIEKYLSYEKLYLEQGKRYICGVDEVGRGPLAGPVSVCACIMDLDKPVMGVRDSKKLTAAKREELSELLMQNCIDYCIVDIEESTIDEINILNAVIRGAVKAVEGLRVKPDIVLADALKLDLEMESLGIIGGDDLSYSIAAASILAKVHRDALMDDIHNKYPSYGFCRNKGYGTPEHISALNRLGPAPVHRKTFIKKILEGVM